MARVLITGSSDGLGLLAGRRLADAGHAVTLHARNQERAEAARGAVPEAEAVLIADVSGIEQTCQLARQASDLEPFDAVIHNVAVGSREPRRVETVDGLSHVFAVNVLAPYLLTCLIRSPRRLVYLSSGMHRGGPPVLDDLQWTRRRWDGSRAYGESKFLDAALAFAVARLWPWVRSNAVEPGWVPTKMGGPGAPDDLELGAATQVWLAGSDDPAANATGQYFFHQGVQDPHPATRSTELQDQVLEACAALTGVGFPVAPD